MSQLDILLAQPIFRSVGNALLDSLWQLALVSLAYAALRLVIRAPLMRYWLGLAALLLMLILPIASAQLHSKTLLGRNPSPAANFSPQVDGLFRAPGSTSDRLGSWATLLWIVGTPIFSLRLGLQYFHVHRVLREQSPVGEDWLRERVKHYARELGIKRVVRVVETTRLLVPATIGWLRPIILFPAGALAGLPPDQLEYLLVHELAHVRRWDYLVNLLQSVIEALLFYHPAVWWVSAQVRIDRETCCDDCVIAMLDDRIAYAKALTGLEIQRTGRIPTAAVAAAGGNLLLRIRRVLGFTSGPDLRISRISIAGLSAAVVAGLVLVAQSSVAGPSAGRHGPQPWATLEQQSELRERAEHLLTRGRIVSLRAIRDDDWITRAAGALSLGETGESADVLALADALKDPEPWVRKNAAIALGRLGDPEGVDALVLALVDAMGTVRERAAESLGQIGALVAADPLVNTFNDDNDDQVREAAARALGMLGESRAVDPLVGGLADANPQVREHAARALGQIGDPRAQHVLRTLMLEDSDPQVRQTALQALAMLQ